jgi:hypothetical protein
MRWVVAAAVLASCSSSRGRAPAAPAPAQRPPAHAAPSPHGDGGAPAAPAGDPPAAVDPATCINRATDLDHWLHTAVAEHDGTLTLTARVHLVDMTSLPLGRVARGPVLEIKQTTQLLDGVEVAAKDLPKLLREARPRILVAIDAEAPIAHAAALLAQASKAGITSAGFLFGHPSAVKPPEASSLSGELAEIDRHDPFTRAKETAAVVRRLLAHCAAGASLLDHVPAGDPDATERAVLDGLKPALIDCGCAADVDGIRAAMWPLVGPGQGVPAVAVEVGLAGAADRKAVVVAGASWNDVAADVVAAARKGAHVKLVARARSR